jgi:SAM-dependent methyltransferase
VSRLTRWLRRSRRALAQERVRRRELAEERELALAPDGFAVPSRALRTRVAGIHSLPLYLRVGTRVARDVASRFREAGVDPMGIRRLVDFGCGCGRVFRRLHAQVPNATLVGLDIDPDAIAWCREHLGRLGSFEVVPHDPPTSCASASADALVAVSVLTHLPPAMQRAWMGEWARIVAPGGHVLFSVSHSDDRAGVEDLLELVAEEDGCSYHRIGPQEGHPDWYQVTFHSEAAARALAAPWFDVLSVRHRGINGHQMTVVARRRR